MANCTKDINICLKRGDDYQETVVWTDDSLVPIDLTGAAVQLDVKSAVDIEPPLLSLSLGSGLTLDGVNGEITIDITGEQTLLLNNVNVYDLQVTEANGYRTTLKGGNLSIQKDVTVLP